MSKEVVCVFVVRVYDNNGTLIPSLLAFHSRAGVEACAKEWVPVGRKYEVIEVQVDDWLHIGFLLIFFKNKSSLTCSLKIPFCFHNI